MLKRLELIGFKSFADRTRFDFAPGITAIVGPNGSGKSNIVDAVRWLLGEQSAKSLRGTEMTDVIFNGSSTRKSLGMAEVTMTFDNTAKQLDFDADEVQITRRVYRDGQGEYLINGQESRLKDIKELFLGSGAGHGAYSVIEQGRVDALLTASTKDRRTIFEEAAGISRFKVKKLETLRKLERVDTDLIRVHDILRELETQLRTLRLAASKAQRYQEYTTRLKALRVNLSLAEFQTITATLNAEEQVLVGVRAAVATMTTDAETGEEDLRKLDWELSRTEETLRHQEAKLAQAKQLIATQEGAAKSERGQTTGLEAELVRVGKQRAELGNRSRIIETEAARVANELDFISQRAAAEKERSTNAAAAVSDVTLRIADLTRQIQIDRDKQMELFGHAMKLEGDRDSYHRQVERLRHDLTRKRDEAERNQTKHDALNGLLADLSQTDTDLQERLTRTRQSLAQHVEQRDALQQAVATIQTNLESLRERRSALQGRADVLAGLEQSLEGFGAGVRAVLHRVQAGEQPLASAIHGLVADLLTVPRDVAPFIDLALGDTSQRFVVVDDNALSLILKHIGTVPGRVGFVTLLRTQPTTSIPGMPDSNTPPPIPIAAFVKCDLEALPTQLLGRVLLVEDLPSARLLSQQYVGYRFITKTGELLDADGTITIGPPLAESGILSRKSELRDLQLQFLKLTTTISKQEAEQTNLRQQADRLAQPIHTAEAEIAALTGQAGSLRDQMLEQRQVQRHLAEYLETLAQEYAMNAGELARGEAAWEQLRQDADDANREAQKVKARHDALAIELAAAEVERDRKVQENTTAQVALSRVNEQLSGLRKKREELETEVRQRRVDAMNHIATDRSIRSRLTDSILTTLRANAIAAEAYADKETRECHLRELSHRRDLVLAARERLQQALKQSRDAWTDQQKQAHARELAVRDLLNRRDTIAQRIREEYGVELGSQPHESSVNEGDSTREINELRQSITKLGSVNLEALDELAEVEKREAELRAQFDDLNNGRNSLRQIIDQINTDSRKLFGDLLATIRVHFQELFRKLFGGGMADIVLEDENDILESGIEITAHPPGKQAQRISLLSGGERALTAVALLLAIYRSKPSPFCLLDEIDAAMDEANTQRLAELLKEFSNRSQFIVITHKKRTMAHADVLHGVTMQESGISKLVAVRFEDWPDEEVQPLRTAA